MTVDKPALPMRTLVLVGVGAESDLHASIHRFTGSFCITELPASAPSADVASASVVRTPDSQLDHTHVVVVLLNANPDDCDDADAHNAHATSRAFSPTEPLPTSANGGAVSDGASSPAGDVGASTAASDASTSASTSATTTSSPSARRLEAMLRHAEAVRAACPHAFILLWHKDAVEDPEMRIAAFASGANMVSCFAAHTEEALTKLASLGTPAGTPAGTCSCDWCGATGMTPDQLWLHQPLYHIYHENRPGDCCACGARDEANLAVHIHEAHRPVALGGPHFEVRRGLGSAVVVHRKRDNKFLMVQEFAGQGFWVPGGGTDEGESLSTSAVRECLEEAGVEVTLEGLVEIAHILEPTTGQPIWRLALFYASLTDEAAAQPKTVPCFESAGSCWVGVDQLETLPLRSPRIPLKWYPHFAGGGAAKPLALPEELAHLFKDVAF